MYVEADDVLGDYRIILSQKTLQAKEWFAKQWRALKQP